jgi:hypothetical protein
LSDKDRRLGALPFVIGGLSFIPLFGVLFGAIAVGWGIITKRIGGRKLALTGVAGVAFNVFLYGGLFYFGFVKRGGLYDHLRAQLAQTQLNALVPQIELYKLQRGEYPASLEQLRNSMPKQSVISVNDPTDVKLHTKSRLFYYQRVGSDHYYLRSVGPDSIPFTADDISCLSSIRPRLTGSD